MAAKLLCHQKNYHQNPIIDMRIIYLHRNINEQTSQNDCDEKEVS